MNLRKSPHPLCRLFKRVKYRAPRRGGGHNYCRCSRCCSYCCCGTSTSRGQAPKTDSSAGGSIAGRDIYDCPCLTTWCLDIKWITTPLGGGGVIFNDGVAELAPIKPRAVLLDRLNA